MTEFPGSLSKSGGVRILRTHEFRIRYLHLWSDHGLICERRWICHKSHACKSLQKTVFSVQHLQILLCVCVLVCPFAEVFQSIGLNSVGLFFLGQSFGPVTTHCLFDSKLKPIKLLRCIETNNLSWWIKHDRNANMLENAAEETQTPQHDRKNIH